MQWRPGVCWHGHIVVSGGGGIVIIWKSEYGRKSGLQQTCVRFLPIQLNCSPSLFWVVCCITSPVSLRKNLWLLYLIAICDLDSDITYTQVRLHFRR